MATSILVTKLFIPTTRQKLVSRPRLIEQLDQGLRQKISLVSAPAGFGKTTIVSHWIKGLQNRKETGGESVRVAWLSLDEADNDSNRFLTYFISALNKASDPENALGTGALNMLQSPDHQQTQLC